MATAVVKNRKRRTEHAYIPSLPDDVALDCLLRVPARSHALLHSVSRKWRDLISSPTFYEQRKKEGTTAHVLCLLQAAPPSSPHQHPVYYISTFNDASNKWERLPPIPEFKHLGLPLFCRLAAVGGRLVVIGGWNPETWETLRAVYVFNFASWTWHRGADMPSTRSFFACAAVGNRVFIAGGHDNTKTALASAEVYDLYSDSWDILPRMNVQRDECTGAVMHGNFYAISGYHTATQCKFVSSAEVYNTTKQAWTPIENMCTVSPGTIVQGSSTDRLFAFHDRQLLSYCEAQKRWEQLDLLPDDEKEGISAPVCAATFGASFLAVTGACSADDQQYRTLLYRLPGMDGSKHRKGQWLSLPVDEQFVGVTQTLCTVEI